MTNRRRSRLLIPTRSAPEARTRGGWPLRGTRPGRPSPGRAARASRRATRLVVEDLGDQEDRVGPGEPGLDDLVLVDDEVFAKQRDRDRSPDPGEVGEVSLEVGDVGQDAEAGRAVALVGRAAMAIGSKSARMTPAEGLAFLTSAINWIGPGPAKRALEIADRRRRGRLVLHLLERHRSRAAATSRRLDATISSRMVSATQ